MHTSMHDETGAGESLSLAPFLLRAYLTYAMSVVIARALPSIGDGLKPVQRRILYDMSELGVTSSSKHVKVARVVGDTMGKYHPHGDAAIADAMVRLAQDFSLRYPVIDGQGNFGSRDGDGAAAQRYIEARLAVFADLMLDELGKGTVDFVPNYDGADTEPAVLPARLPFVLLNGGSGVAVGYSTEIPAHNLREVANATVAVIRNPQSTLQDLLEIMPGPDYPNGGQVTSSPAHIESVYASGQGSFKMRARWRVEELAQGNWRLVIYEMPYGVSARSVMEQIESLTNPKPSGERKDLTPHQKQTRTLFLAQIRSIRDEANKKEQVRLVVEPQNGKQRPEDFADFLFAHTMLEQNVPVQMVMIGIDGKPRCKGLVEILQEWVAFRFICVERRLRTRLGNVDARLHILAGRMLVFLSLDKVLKVIREADEPKAELMSQFELTEIQAEDILEIRLRQLARLEGFKLEKEMADLKGERADLVYKLEHREALTDLIVGEIEADAAKYGDDRRTLIQEAEVAKKAPVAAMSEPVTVVVSKHGWLRTRQGHGVDRKSLGYKAGDGELAVIEARTDMALLVFDNNGRAYTVKVTDIPGGRGDGVPVSTLIDLQKVGGASPSIVHAIVDSPESTYLFAGTGGYGFAAKAGDIVARNRAGRAFMTLLPGEHMIKPAKLSTDTVVAAFCSDKASRLLAFAASEVKALPKGGRGVMLVKLGEGEDLTSIAAVAGEVTVITDGAGHTLDASALDNVRGKRASRGAVLKVNGKITDVR